MAISVDLLIQGHSHLGVDECGCDLEDDTSLRSANNRHYAACTQFLVCINMLQIHLLILHLAVVHP
jgi:hypothetical protein